MSSLEVKNVSYAYEKENPILTDLAFSVADGESVGIIGANGVGKSTLLKMMVGLLLDFSGEIRINDLSVTKQNLADIRAKIGDKQIYKMSGGEKKLISIATILSMTPDIILMDEPTTALDPRNRRNLIHLLNSFPQIKLIASHDLDFVLDTCSRTILMAQGRVICEGRTEEILHNKELLEANGLELPLSIHS